MTHAQKEKKCTNKFIFCLLAELRVQIKQLKTFKINHIIYKFARTL